MLHCSDFWVHVEKLTALVLQLTVQVRKLDPQIKKTLQQQLDYLAEHQLSVLEWELIASQEELSVHLTDAGESSKTGSIPLHRVVLYLLEGFLPLLSEFSSKLCAHIGGQNRACIEALTPQKMQVLFNFHKILQVRSVHIQCIYRSLYETLNTKNMINVAFHTYKMNHNVRNIACLLCVLCVHLLTQKLRLLNLDTGSFHSCSTGEESTISSCLKNTGVLLVTVNAEGASGIDLVSTVLID